jgi:hypothetical protein
MRIWHNRWLQRSPPIIRPRKQQRQGLQRCQDPLDRGVCRENKGNTGMALRPKSLDEITNEIVDVYDATLQKAAGKPVRVWRNNNNKLYLLFHGIAAGFKVILDAIISLRGRFDPLYSDSVDLYTTCKLVGTRFKEGTGSIVSITITNKNTSTAKMFYAGIYNYSSVSGMVFSFELPDGYLFDPGEKRVISAISREKGAFRVEDNAGIKVAREDNTAIDAAFTFSCSDNSGQLGYPDEDELSFRTRIMNDANRQDHISELELKIRNLPNIFECNLVFNQSTDLLQYDDIILMPWELLIIITGAPTNEIAKLVSQDVIYSTHKINDEQVVYYENDLYVNGRKAVYYKYHDTANFSLHITYQYNHEKLKNVLVENAVNALLSRYTNTVIYTDIITENTIYTILEALNLPDVIILDVNIQADGESVPFFKIPKTRLPHLTGITFTAIDEGGQV